MVDDNLISAQEAAEILGVNMNNLRQIQFRKSITWAKKIGRTVHYNRDDIMAYKAKRDARKSK